MFAYTSEDRWQFGIGDPTVMGWLTVAAYWVAAMLCWRLALRPRGASQRSTGAVWFWLISGLILVALGVNKQLDFQTWLTLQAKQIAIHQGWYEQRRLVQAGFIGVVAIAGAAVLVWMLWLGRRSGRSAKMALAGLVFLGCFVLIRASSFHRMDELIGLRVAGLKMNWLLELGGIACVAIAAVWGQRERHE